MDRKRHDGGSEELEMSKQKKPPKEPDYSKMSVLPSRLIEFVQAKYGLSPDELLKLTESLGRVNPDLKVERRENIKGKEYPKMVGKVLSIAEAAQYERERVESRLTKEQKIHELIDDSEVEDLLVRFEVDSSIYPKRLSPSDIAICVDSAGEKLDALDQERIKPRKIYSPREETVLDVITLIKKQEALRVATRIANRQRAYVLGKPIEELEAEYKEWLRELKGEPTEAERLAMEKLAQEEAEAAAAEAAAAAAEEAIRNFGDLPDVRTLLDDAAALIRDNPEAAAAIIRQWIGNPTVTEAKS